MPFHNYKLYYNYNSIKYTDGDLIYGMGRNIYNYVNNVETFLMANPNKKASTMYQYAINIKENIKYNFYLPDKESTNSFIKSIQSHKKYRSILRLNINFDEKDDIDHEIQEFYSRKSKAGIKWAQENGHSVHYILDDIDIDSVINKTMNIGKSGSPIKSIVNSEIRYIYRNRKDPKMQNTVQFWRGGRPSNTPWVDDPAKWHHYKPKSEANRLEFCDAEFSEITHL